MAHVAKYTRGALGHMFAHYERAKGKDNEYIKFGNENIDTSKSHLNYNLGPKRNISQGDFVKKRCNEVKCLNRKDVNVMCSWVITAPKDLDLKQQKKFFIESYKFLESRYGADNVISAYVHLDEVTPHMHFSFVPVIYDAKKDVLKVSAKQKISKSDLPNEYCRHIQDTFYPPCNFPYNSTAVLKRLQHSHITKEAFRYGTTAK